jgi:hypothetical protein
MPGRGPQTFKKRQKEQQRKERQQEKMAKRMQRKEDHRLGLHGDNNTIAPLEPEEALESEREESEES